MSRTKKNYSKSLLCDMFSYRRIIINISVRRKQQSNTVARNGIFKDCLGLAIRKLVCTVVFI